MTYTYSGKTKPLREWAQDKLCRVKYRTLARRVAEGWTFALALTTPPLNRNLRPRVEYSSYGRGPHPHS